MAKTALEVAHRNDRAQIKRVLAGQALLPMLDLLEGKQASIDDLMHVTAVALVEQSLGLSTQDLVGAKPRGRDGGPVLWHSAQRGVMAPAERQLRVQRRFIEASAFGQRAHIQRYRTHQLRKVLERLPKTEAAQTKAVMMAA